MARPSISEEEKRRNLGLSVGPATPKMLKELQAEWERDGRARSEGRLIDELVVRAFMTEIDTVMRRRNHVLNLAMHFDNFMNVWTFEKRRVELTSISADGMLFAIDDGVMPGQFAAAFPIAPIADSIAQFLLGGSVVDPRRKPFPVDADVWFFPSYDATGKSMPVTITFIAGEDVTFFQTEGDRLLPIPPKGTGVYVKLPGGHEYRGTVMAANINPESDSNQSMSVVVKALGT